MRFKTSSDGGSANGQLNILQVVIVVLVIDFPTPREPAPVPPVGRIEVAGRVEVGGTGGLKVETRVSTTHLHVTKSPPSLPLLSPSVSTAEESSLISPWGVISYTAICLTFFKNKSTHSRSYLKKSSKSFKTCWGE
jgi:hypothetical protein